MKIPYDAGLQYCLARGVNAYSHDDKEFGTDYVFCNSHRAVHIVGWCTVPNYAKIALDFPMLEDAVKEAKRMGLL